MSLDLGKKYLSQKNFKDAEKIFLDLNKNNNNFEINYNLAIINFELKNIKKSLKFFDKCKKIDPKSLAVPSSFINAPCPILISITSPSIPSAIFLLIIEPQINGRESIVSVTSLRA